MRNTERDIEHLWIPMPDGRRLAARIWLPEQGGPVPAILEYLPYRKRDGTAPRDATTHRVFAGAGYACIRVDMNGTGEADGLHDDEYSERELADGEAVLEWIAAQEWCSGNIGIIGISWGGFNGLQLAFRRPPALKAIVTVCSTVDRYADDIHYMGGCLLTDNFNWGAQMTAYQTRPPDPLLRDDWREQWLARIEALPFYAADWLRHQTRDELWKHGSVCEDWSAIQAATLAIGGWADAYVNAPCALAANVAGAKALIGPWEHKYAHIAQINPADFHGEVIDWFDRWLKGEDRPDLPAYRAFIQEHDAPSPNYGPRSGRWVAEAAWPSPNVATRTLHLGDGLIDAPGQGTRAIATPNAVGAKAAYFCPGMRVENELSDDQAGDDALSVCFDLPIDTPLELLGRAGLAISFETDKPAAQIMARLCDVAPDGTSVRISYRGFNLTHHASHETPEALEPGQRYTARFQLNEMAHRLKPGHTLRLALSTGYWPVIWPAPDPATVTLHLADCALHLPVREATTEIDPQAPGKPRAFPRLEAETLRDTDSRTTRSVDGQGNHVLEVFDDYGCTRDPEHGLEDGSMVTQVFTIHPDDPLSAKHESRWQFTFRRGDWSVKIDTENTMTADATDFHLHRRATAYEGDTVVADKEWHETIPRGHL